MFLRGLLTIHRSDKFWNELSSDLVIEQTLMQSVRTYRGLTRGCGMDGLQRSIWQLPTPATSEVNRAMQEFTGLKHQTRDQHKYLPLSRTHRDDQNA